MANEIQTFKISQLSSVSKVNNEDLLLVSNYDPQVNKFFSKKMDLNQLMNFVVSSEYVQTYINEEINKKTMNFIQQYLQNEANISSEVLKIISANSQFVLDSLDGLLDEQVIIG